MAQEKIFGKSGARAQAWSIFIRVVLGVILIWKAINLIADTSALKLLTVQDYESVLTKNDAVLIVIFGVITVVCGFFIMAGLFTRVAAFIQLPVFLLSILFIHGGYIDRNGFELILTAIVPFLLLELITKDDHVLESETYSQNKSSVFLESENEASKPSIFGAHKKLGFNGRFHSQLLYGILILITGVIVVSLSYNSSRLIQYTVGTGMFLASIFALVASFKVNRLMIPKQYNGFLGLGTMVYALTILVYAATFERFITVTMIFLLYVGITELLFGFQLMAYKTRISMTVNALRMIPGFLMTIGSVIVLMMANLDRSSSLLSVGIIIVLSGINLIWFTRITKRLGQPY